MRTSRLSCIAEIKKMASENVTRKASPEEKAQRIAALETMRRIFSSMSEKAFQVHLEGYDEDHNTPTKFLKALFTVILLVSSIPAFSQLKLTRPVPAEIIRVFQYAECGCSQRDTLTVQKFPASYRSTLVNLIYEPMAVIPFEIFYAEKRGGQIYFISRGICRGISTLIPIRQPGWYFVRFYDEQKPALIEINAETTTFFIQEWGKCTLH